MKNIVLSCSQQAWNKCVVGDSEQDHTFEIAKAIDSFLQSYQCNTFLVPKQIGTENETLTKVVSLSNSFIATNKDTSYHLDIHTDGGYNGSGASGFYMSEAGKSFIQKIHKSVSAITPWGDGDVSKRNLYVLRETDAIAGLIEISFHDQIDEAKWIHQNINLIGITIGKAIVAELGLSLKPDSIKKHWAQESYDYLVAKGIKISETRFDDKITRGEVFTLLAQIKKSLL